MLARDGGESVTTLPELHRQRLARHLRRWPSERQLLTYLVVLAARTACDCPKCEGEAAMRKRECEADRTQKLLADWLPGYMPAPETGGQASPVDSMTPAEMERHGY